MMPTENVSEAPELGPPQYKRQMLVPNCDPLNENPAHPPHFMKIEIRPEIGISMFNCETRHIPHCMKIEIRPEIGISMFNCAAVKNGSNRLSSYRVNRIMDVERKW